MKYRLFNKEINSLLKISVRNISMIRYMNISYHRKYLKYKKKYIDLQKHLGGMESVGNPGKVPKKKLNYYEKIKEICDTFYPDNKGLKFAFEYKYDEPDDWELQDWAEERKFKKPIFIFGFEINDYRDIIRLTNKFVEDKEFVEECNDYFKDHEIASILNIKSILDLLKLLFNELNNRCIIEGDGPYDECELNISNLTIPIGNIEKELKTHQIRYIRNLIDFSEKEEVIAKLEEMDELSPDINVITYIKIYESISKIDDIKENLKFFNELEFTAFY